ncbi:MAG: WYL domain-containing protein, partial [Actinomycetota bacterium]
VRAVRAGDHPPGGAAAEERPGVGGADGLPTALRRLLAAGRDGVSVWLGYVDAGGRSSRRLVDPLAVANGQLTAYDHLHEEVRVFALHRVTDVAFPDTDHPPPGHDQPATARGTA